jgi:tRNA modification GTPase
VIAGRPNSGKSSLFNALLGVERAIVTDVAGTTRDAIEAPVSCGGFPFRLVDTAGLHAASERIEQLGIEVSRRYLTAADLVLFCVETGRPLAIEEEQFLDDVTAPRILVRTKCDVGGAPVEDASPKDWAAEVVVSALTGEGLARLRSTLAQVAFGLLASRAAEIEPLITRERHRLALELANKEVSEFTAARRVGIEGAVAATHLRAAVASLEDIIGVIATDDVLDRLFTTFCVGK